MEVNNVISKFIHNFQLLDREDILGIIFYGSSCYHTNSEQSDIDLLLVTDGCYNYKGVTYIEGKKIEYFERNVYDLLTKIEHFEQSPDRSLLSTFQNGQIIFSKNEMMEYLKQEILMRSKYIPKKPRHKTQNSNISLFYHILQQSDKESGFGKFVFYNLLEQIRKKYHQENGYTKMSTMKVYTLYSNKNYAENFYCLTLPNSDFIEQYLNLITEGYSEEKLKNIMSYISYSDIDSLEQEFSNHSKAELKYSSTIVKNAVDKSCFLLDKKTPDASSCYYIALEKTRKLYCDINGIDSRLDQIGEEYDTAFLELFDNCLNKNEKTETLNQLFSYVTTPLQMDYKNYKVYELI